MAFAAADVGKAQIAIISAARKPDAERCRSGFFLDPRMFVCIFLRFNLVNTL